MILKEKNALLCCFVQTNKPFWLANLFPLWIKSCIMQISLSVILFLYLDFFFLIFPLDHGLHDIFFLFLSFCCLQRLLGGFDRCGGAIACWWYWRCVPHRHLSAIISTNDWPLTSYFEPECKIPFSFPVPVAVALGTCLSGSARSAAGTRCAHCTLGWMFGFCC